LHAALYLPQVGEAGVRGLHFSHGQIEGLFEGVHPGQHGGTDRRGCGCLGSGRGHAPRDGGDLLTGSLGLTQAANIGQGDAARVHHAGQGLDHLRFRVGRAVARRAEVSGGDDSHRHAHQGIGCCAHVQTSSAADS